MTHGIQLKISVCLSVIKGSVRSRGMRSSQGLLICECSCMYKNVTPGPSYLDIGELHDKQIAYCMAFQISNLAHHKEVW